MSSGLSISASESEKLNLSSSGIDIGVTSGSNGGSSSSSSMMLSPASSSCSSIYSLKKGHLNTNESPKSSSPVSPVDRSSPSDISLPAPNTMDPAYKKISSFSICDLLKGNNETKLKSNNKKIKTESSSSSSSSKSQSPTPSSRPSSPTLTKKQANPPFPPYLPLDIYAAEKLFHQFHQHHPNFPNPMFLPQLNQQQQQQHQSPMPQSIEQLFMHHHQQLMNAQNPFINNEFLMNSIENSNNNKKLNDQNSKHCLLLVPNAEGFI